MKRFWDGNRRTGRLILFKECLKNNIIPFVANVSHKAEYYHALNTAQIKQQLAQFAPDQVIWDIDDRSLTPPWGDNISEDITDLSNYFVTSEGKDFLTVFAVALDKAQQRNAPLKIQAL